MLFNATNNNNANSNNTVLWLNFMLSSRPKRNVFFNYFIEISTSELNYNFSKAQTIQHHSLRWKCR